MVNEREKEVLENLEDDGWKVIRGGWPDFLALKVNDRKIEDFKAIEVKRPDGELAYKQELCRLVLEKLGMDYEVEVVE